MTKHLSILIVLATTAMAHAEVLKLRPVNGDIVPNRANGSNPVLPQCSKATEAELERVVSMHPIITHTEDTIIIDTKTSSGNNIHRDASRTVVIEEEGEQRIIGFWDEGTSTFAVSVSRVPTKDNKTRPVRLFIIRRAEGQPKCVTKWVGSGEVQ
jgi:hypothetical protein